MLTKPVDTRATTASRAGCLRRGLGRKTPFQGAATASLVPRIAEDPAYCSSEGLTASKISVIEQLAYKNKALVIVLQETHCTTAQTAGDSQLFTSWVSPEEEARPCNFLFTSSWNGRWSISLRRCQRLCGCA